MFEKYYFTGLLLITAVILVLYYQYNKYHNMELKKIDYLEEKKKENDRLLELIRAKTDACPKLGLETPRDCYFGSDFKCSWNEQAQRCDVISYI